MSPLLWARCSRNGASAYRSNTYAPALFDGTICSEFGTQTAFGVARNFPPLIQDARGRQRRDMNLLIENEAALEIEQHIQERVGGRVRDLRVFRRDGRLVLEGFSHSFHAKQLATHAVLESGLSDELVNDIVVDRQR